MPAASQARRCVNLPAPHHPDKADDAAHQPLFPAPRQSVSNLSPSHHAATAGQEVCGPDLADLEIGDSQTVGSTGGRLVSGYRGGIVMAACCGSPVLALCLAHACDMRVNLQTKARTPWKPLSLSTFASGSCIYLGYFLLRTGTIPLLSKRIRCHALPDAPLPAR